MLFALALILGCGWAAWYTHRKGKVVWNIILLSTTMVLVGFSSYASVTIRAAANPPMNSNNPNNPHALLSMLNRDQYGDRPLLLGAYYSAPPEGYKEKSFYYLDEDGKYKPASVITGYTHSPEFVHFFPRMWDARKGEKEYKQWGAYRTRTDVMRDDKGEILRDEQGRPIRGEVVDFGRKKLYNDGYEDRTIVEPTFAENLNFFFNYQLSYMYWRYFLWNFVGRQSDIQPTRTQITDGNWLSGIKWIDEKFLGPQDDLPREIAENKGYGPLKLQAVRGSLHLFLETLYERVVSAVQKVQGLAEVGLIFLPGNISLAGGVTLLDVIIETRTLLSRILWQVPAAGPDAVQFVYQIQRVLHGPGAGIRTKVTAPAVLLHVPGKQKAWKILPHGCLDIGIAFVIL